MGINKRRKNLFRTSKNALVPDTVKATLVCIYRLNHLAFEGQFIGKNIQSCVSFYSFGVGQLLPNFCLRLGYRQYLFL